MQTAKVDGQTVKVGDYVCFKSDYEQCGKVTKITKNMFGHVMLELYRDDEGFGGDYIGGSNYTVQSASDCWVE
jgi:hypothetical protein